MFSNTAVKHERMLAASPLNYRVIPVVGVPPVYDECNIHATGNVCVEGSLSGAERLAHIVSRQKGDSGRFWMATGSCVAHTNRRISG